MPPTMPAVPTITIELPPASACAAASTSALRLARRSVVSTNGSAMADMNISRQGAFGERAGRSNGRRRISLLRGAQGSHEPDAEPESPESEVQRAGMPDHHVACFGRRARSDLAERRTGLLGKDVDHMGGPAAAERTEPPQKGLAGERPFRAKRERPRHVGTAADARIH